MRKMICSPGTYVQGEGEIAHLAEHIENMGKASAYLIVDSFIDQTYHEDIIKSFEEKTMKYKVQVFGGECCDQEINLHRDQMKEYDVVLGIGGGKTLDTSKAVSYYENCPVMIVPTAASSDAPCSRLSVVYTPEGQFSHYLPLTKNPDMVIMDTEVIAKAPARFLAAGIGDALATYYEAAACVRSNAVTMAGGHVTKAAITLAKLCRDTLLEEGYQAFVAVTQGQCTKAVENIIEANTYLSGVGFESGGLSGAHAIHNGLTALEATHKLLHGEKVAFGTVTQLVLENNPLDEIKEIIHFCKKLGLPTSLEALGISNVTDEELLVAATEACSKEDTMGNLPFEVTPKDIVAAMRTVDALSKEI